MFQRNLSSKPKQIEYLKKSITEYTNIYLVQKNLRLQNIS